ncbi:MAG: autotransporter assembly complex protein TamA [Defluviicoccus sp.]|nr:autotransporter assembly complex protein TamA [Defluviicoccus sp.]MDG4609756.1 autotransporter assembly complex protein TamA [Defluviicoccus sp.]
MVAERPTRARFPLARLAPLLCALLLLLQGCAQVTQIRERLFGSERAEGAALEDVDATASEPIPYEVRIEGELPASLKALLEASSGLIANKDRPPASLAALRRRVADDVQRFNQVLQSEAYYDARIDTTTDTAVQPAQVTLRITPGPRFRLEAYEIVYEPGPPPAKAPLGAGDVGLKIGIHATASPLVEAERTLLARLSERGHPNARLIERRYVADRAARTVRATIRVDAGPAMKIGPLHIDGLERVRQSYVERLVQWHEGRTFDSRELDRIRSVLAGTQLFSTISIEREEPAEGSEAIPVRLTLKERKRRSVGVGASYATDEEGFGGQLSWEHRNLFGRGESLRLRATGSMIGQSVDARFRKPYFLNRKQAIVADTRLRRESSEAFDELSISSFAGIERRFYDHWMITSGPAFVLAQLEQDGNQDNYVLVGLSSTLIYDTRDDELDPTKGIRAALAVAPYVSVAGTQTQFVVTNATLAGYQRLVESGRFVLAGRGRLGSIQGDSRSTVPANMRLYAGGGGSVRGYAFRTLGPLDDDNNPLGGRSAVELNTELRTRLTESLGLVTFVDGGQVYDEVVPTFDNDLQWAAGLGARYFTGFGPLRFDIAFPLNGRDVDDLLQFYISIGQAF